MVLPELTHLMGLDSIVGLFFYHIEGSSQQFLHQANLCGESHSNNVNKFQHTQLEHAELNNIHLIEFEQLFGLEYSKLNQHEFSSNNIIQL